jgi:aldose 1-epimerase
MSIDLLTLSNQRQQLQLAPGSGAGIARWDWSTPLGEVSLLCPANGLQDPFCLGGLALLPWSNRMTQGGFAHQGVHYAVPENRAGEPYPIHGDGWMQSWNVASQGEDEAVLRLESRRHHGNPHEYDAQQHIRLHENGFSLTLAVTHRGRVSLPYGLGMSLCFACDQDSRLQAPASGIWLSGPDPIPIAHTSSFPAGWDFRRPAPPAAGQPLDNCYTGWDGEMRLSRPREHLMLMLRMKENSGYYVLQRAQGASHFSFAAVTHPIDAFHAKARPGLVSLANGESLTMELDLQVQRMEPAGEAPARQAHT